MKILRVPALTQKLKKIQVPAFLWGLFLGAAVIMSIAIAFFSFQRSFDTSYLTPTLELFRGQFFAIVFVIFFAFNLYGWSKSGVNHVLIFELDPRDNVNFLDTIWVGSFLIAIWLTSVLVFVMFYSTGRSGPLFPAANFIFLFIFLFNPIDIFYRSSRYWFVKIFARNFLSPFISVRFADFWLYDQLNSLAPALVDLLCYTPCFCFYDIYRDPAEWKCKNPLIMFPSILKIFPALVRLLQCLRRFYDFSESGKPDIPQITNAMKYFSSVLVIIATLIYDSLVFQQKNALTALKLVIFFRFISNTLFLTFWDIFVDWSFFGSTEELLQGKITPGLREKVIYKRYLYYMALFQNLILRNLWVIPSVILYINYNLSFPSFYLDFFINLAEIYRRFVWNFFRLENEHLNNVGRYRVVRDISIRPLLPNSNNGRVSSLQTNDENRTSSYREFQSMITSELGPLPDYRISEVRNARNPILCPLCNLRNRKVTEN